MFYLTYKPHIQDEMLSQETKYEKFYQNMKTEYELTKGRHT